MGPSICTAHISGSQNTSVTVRVTLRAFSRNLFRVPRALFRKAPEESLPYDGEVWRTKHEAVGHVDIQSEVEVMVCLRVLRSATS